MTILFLIAAVAVFCMISSGEDGLDLQNLKLISDGPAVAIAALVIIGIMAIIGIALL